MPGLLYPAYQKYYSALCNLERFDKETDFFDNISCLDGFFSEYRNITFALQKQLKGTAYFSSYEHNRDTYLKDHWFVEKRNETTKQEPFQLIKTISITIYFQFIGVPTLETEFSVEDDVPLDSLLPELKRLFSKIKEAEVFFSVAFSFHERNSNIDLFDKLISGIASMQQFLDAMEKDVGEDCPLCNQIKERIKKMKISDIPRDFLLVNDYVYYPENETFERGERFTMMLSLDGKKVANHLPLPAMTQSAYLNYDGTAFGNFTFMHAILRCVQPGLEIMPTLMIVYDDETYDLDAFHADIKTTAYRKINDAAKLIANGNVKEVCFMCLYSVLPASQNISPISKDRVKMSTSDIMVCASVDYQLNEKEYVFDGKAMEQPDYVGCVMKNGRDNSLNLSRTNMFPIWYAFKIQQEKRHTTEEPIVSEDNGNG